MTLPIEPMSRRSWDWDDPGVDWIEAVLQAWRRSGVTAAEMVLAQHPPGSIAGVSESYPGQPKLPATTTRFGLAADDSTVPARRVTGATWARLEVDVFERDGYRCSYCDRRLIALPVFGVLVWGFHDSPLWPWARDFVNCHPVVLPRWPAVDHIHPIAKGGHPSDLANLATACWRCNTTKSSHFVEELKGWPEPRIARPAERFDGLMREAAAVMRVTAVQPPVQYSSKSKIEWQLARTRQLHPGRFTDGQQEQPTVRLTR